MSDLTTMLDELGLDEAARTARATIEHALERFSEVQRQEFWTAIGLYYSTRRHPGAEEAAGEAQAV